MENGNIAGQYGFLCKMAIMTPVLNGTLIINLKSQLKVNNDAIVLMHEPLRYQLQMVNLNEFFSTSFYKHKWSFAKQKT